MFHFPFQTKLNAMGNYLARSWTPTLKCMQCKENTLELSDLSVKNNSNYCIVPLCWVTFWTHPKIIPVGQFFRRWIKSINQAYTTAVNLSVDWLIDDQLTMTWLVYWIRTARSVFTGAGLKWPNTAGQYSIVPKVPAECGAYVVPFHF